MKSNWMAGIVRRAHRPTRGYTLVEVLVAVGIFSLVIAALYSLWHVAGAGAQKALASADGVRSCMLATESIRQDLARKIYQDRAKDLTITPDGRGLMIRVAAPLEKQSDFWTEEGDPIGYYLEPLSGSSTTYRLMRQDSTGARPVQGCFLKDLQFRQIYPRGSSVASAFLQVTAIAPGSGPDQEGYALSLLCPLSLATIPDAEKVASLTAD
jgi:prepilin-type N-terminal cleavage/methylation domain-containing protein